MANKFNKGDRVRVKDNYFNSAARGREGIVEEEDIRNIFLDGLVAVKLDNGSKVTLSSESLELVKTPAAKEGEKIDAKDIKVGMTVRVSLVTDIGASYKQVSTKEGVVTRLRPDTIGPLPVACPDGATEVTLSFGSRNQFYTLIKDAPEVDEIAEALKALKPGSVVQIEDDGAGEFKTTYIKTNGTHSGVPLWMCNESRYAYSNGISEAGVRKRITSLDQIVVKH